MNACWTITWRTAGRAKHSAQYVLRHKVEIFRQVTSDLAKPPELDPEMYMDWGDDSAYSLQLGPRRVRRLSFANRRPRAALRIDILSPASTAVAKGNFRC